MPVALLGVVLVLAYYAFAPGLHGPWLLDDSVNLGPLRLQSMTWAEIQANIFASPRLGGWSRSLTLLTLAVTDYIYGVDTFPFKHHNLLLHLANGLLIFWFVRLLFTAAGRAGAANWAALIVAAIWLLHPLQVSTVLYVIQRLVLLSSFFSLLALCLYVEGRLLAHRRPLAGTAAIACALGFVWPLAIISKENAVLVVLVVPLLELFVLRWRTQSRRERTLLRWLLAVFIALPIVLGTLYLALRAESLLAGYAGRDFTPVERFMTQAHVLWLYLKLIAFPIPGLMTLHHDGFPVQRVLDSGTIVAALGLIAILAAAVLLRRRAPLVGFGLAWFFAWHVLESSVLGLELVFEHRNYLALMGLAVALVAAGAALMRAQKLRVPMAVGVVALLAMLALNTAARAFVWSDYDLLIEADYQQHPTSPRVLEGLVIIHMNRGDAESALGYVEELKALVPDAAFPMLWEVLIRCDVPGGASEAFAKALALTRTERLRPATNTLAGRLMRKVHSSGCAGVLGDDVVQLTKALTENPRTHIRTTPLAALGTHAMATMLNGDAAAAEHALNRLIALAYAHAPSRFAESIEVAAMAASELPTRDEAFAFLDRVTREYADVLAARRIRVRLSQPIGRDHPKHAAAAQ
jgi:protein O-mannosyl-transferase